MFWSRWRRPPDWSWFLQIWAEWQSRGVPRDLRLENWDVNYILNHLSSHLSSPPGTNTATYPLPSSEVVQLSYPGKEAFMNIKVKVGLVRVIHCVGQSLTPRVWVTVVRRLYKVSSISHQRQKPMKARSVWHPTFISPHLSSDWSWARSNYMNNRQRGINQRRHLKRIPRPENDQLSYSGVSRNIIYTGDGDGDCDARYLLSVMSDWVRLSQTEWDSVRLSVWVTLAGLC